MSSYAILQDFLENVLDFLPILVTLTSAGVFVIPDKCSVPYYVLHNAGERVVAVRPFYYGRQKLLY
ncbi:MAG: hypothetical protein LBI37_00465 [Puniceicoccales bacterium]|nr:hypothetical protein [Puniceicoccales bacterium]